MKYCSKCKRTEIETFFSPKPYSGGKYYYCRECANKKSRAYYKTDKGRENIKKAVFKSIKKHYQKQLTRVMLNQAIQKGFLVRPKKCSNCNKKGKIQGHHEDYNKPLDVIWLCISCHSDVDNGVVTLK